MHRLQPNTSDASRDMVFWLTATTLVLGQLLAFWLVCSQQVRNAQVRQTASQVEQLAVADCLRYIPHATRISCAARVAPLDQQAQAVANAEASDANPPENAVSH